MKLVLILNVINPGIGGVLIWGEKGTAKSTAVRALARLLPEIEVVAGCPCNCDPQTPERLCPFCRERLERGEKLETRRRPVPVVELPVSATEDRVAGSLDFEPALRYGQRRLAPGLLAQANRGILYVDEVNLLDDHLVDLVLDAAASGVNVVEREGVSAVHPARFALVGTMNPEEGELRPQLLDRFGLCVAVGGLPDPTARAELVRRREAFDADPGGFAAAWAPREEELRRRLARARAGLRAVALPAEVLTAAAVLAREAACAGHRAEIVLVEAARALAAWEGREAAEVGDLERVAELVLRHRRREGLPPQPSRPEAAPPPPEPPERPEADQGEEPPPESGSGPEEFPPSAGAGDMDLESRPHPEEGSGPATGAGAGERWFAVGRPFPVRRIEFGRDRRLRKGSGRRSRTRTPTRLGRYVRAVPARGTGDVALDATLRAAAPYQTRRCRVGVAVVVEPGDLREKVREKRVGNLLLFVVDASGSMGAQQRMVAAKGAIFSLLLDAYQKRDRVGMVAFRGERAEVLLPPTNSVELAHRCLAELPTGGRTPLAAGLWKAYELALAHLSKNLHLSPLLIVISDGRANVALGKCKPLEEAWRVAELIRREERVQSLVVDAEGDGFLNLGLARRLAEALGAAYYRIEDLRSQSLAEAVRAAAESFRPVAGGPVGAEYLRASPGAGLGEGRGGGGR
ncbi:MAG: magnesium chelatase subunit D family protein [Moorellales bacterium]